jgi:excisionase family DNA binding protein
MEAILEKTSRADQRIAKVAADKLERNTSTAPNGKEFVEITFPGSNEMVKIPAKAARLLFEIVDNMAQGNSLALVRQDKTVTTQQAANFLNVSRPFVVKLLKTGAIPYVSTGTHRRIIFGDLAAYDQKMKADRFKQLAILAKQAQELNLGYS